MADEVSSRASTTLGEIFRSLRDRFATAGADSPELTARILIEHVTGLSGSTFVSDPGRTIDPSRADIIEKLAERRLAGEPVHRITGSREFYGIEFKLNTHTLEPRPDTEIVVDVAIAAARKVVNRKNSCRLLDLGTGTGAIAVSVLANVTGATAIATDIAPQALEIARQNAITAGVGKRFDGLISDWFGTVVGEFDIIVSNPPYIPTGDIAGLAFEVREHDPAAALDGGTDGLDCYRKIATGAGAHLAGDGTVIVEIGQGQQPDVTSIFDICGYRILNAHGDLGGIIRALEFRPN